MKYTHQVMSVVAYVKRQMESAEIFDKTSLGPVGRMDVKTVLVNAIAMLEEKDQFGRY